MKKYFLTVCLITGFLYSVCAGDYVFNAPIAPHFVSSKISGMGGPHAAAVIGFDTMFTNPAGLAVTGSRKLIGNLGMQFSGPLEDIWMELTGSSGSANDDPLNKILKLVKKNNGVNIGADVSGPIAFGSIKNGVGFGLFNRTFIIGDVPSLTKSYVSAGEELLLIGGWGFNIFETKSTRLSAGFTVKGFAQLQVSYNDAPTKLADLSNSAVELPLWLTTGFGIDAGLLYSFADEVVNIGVVWKDAFTPAFTSRAGTVSLGSTAEINWQSPGAAQTDYIASDLSAGICINIPVGFTKGFISSWKIMADYRNILDFMKPLSRNPILNVTAGTELVLFKAISLRAGIYDMYFSAGVGIGIGVFKIDAAIYAKELGLEPGSAPQMNAALSIGFNY